MRREESKTTSAAAGRFGFARSNARTNALINLSSTSLAKRIDVEAPEPIGGARIFDAVNQCGLDIDILKTGFGQFRHEFVIAQGTGGYGPPKAPYSSSFRQVPCPRTKNIGHGKAAAQLQAPETLPSTLQHAVFASRELERLMTQLG
jgi:hypothetical protein